MSEAIIALLNQFGAKLQGDLAFKLTAQGEIPDGHPLALEISAAVSGEAASLPYPSGSTVVWATIAPTVHDLRAMVEDLRAWVIPSLGWETVPSIVSVANGAGELSTLLLAQSPHGFFRWRSRLRDLGDIVARLAAMRMVGAGAPVRSAKIRPTLSMLRRTFALGLATGDRDTALHAVDKIDKLQLDRASNALAMRIRLAAAFGDDQLIVDHPQLDFLLSTPLPKRVAEGVLVAHYNVVVASHEETGGATAALRAYLPYHDRLDGLAGDPAAAADFSIVRMAAYGAAAGADPAHLRSLAQRFAGDPVVNQLAQLYTSGAVELPVSEACLMEAELVSVEAAAPAETIEFAVETVAIPLGWSLVPSWVASGGRAHLADFLQQASQSPDDCDPGDGDFLIELFTDNGITGDAAKLAKAEQVLTTVIDAYVCDDRFPRRERQSLYQSVLDVWCSSRATSTDPIDGQMLLTLGDALLRLDADFEKSVATAINGWWRARPVRTRLAWLSEALELLTEQSASQDYLELWFLAASIIKLDHHGLSIADLRLWLRLGRRLGLDPAAADEALGGVNQASAETADPLSLSGFKKIAIVSLHERPAQEAAAEIRERTGANVLVVVDHAAGEGTSAAATADVILFVWGATKHAVYRAFDKVRDRLEYVQGTGSASIVRALERRAVATG